jgi:hypothetical protein
MTIPLQKIPGSHKRHSFSLGEGSVVGRWDVSDLAVPIVFHMIFFSTIFSKCAHSVSIMLPNVSPTFSNVLQML